MRRRCRRTSAKPPRHYAPTRLFRQGFGSGFVDYYAHIKEAEYARFMTEAGKEADVTAWEQNEYFDLF